LNHIFDQTVGNPRAITELINRYRKEPFGHANNQGNSPPRIARNRHDLDRNCHSALLTSLRFCRAKWTNPPCGSSLNGHDFAVFSPPDDGELQEKSLCKFCPKLALYKPVNIIILSVHASDYIYITQ
jgi:hypothetical protein